MYKIFFFLLVLPSSFFAQTKSYPDGHGKFVKLPLGDISFADTVISYKVGNPAPAAKYAVPDSAIGLPDFNNADGGFVCLGRNGELVVKFNNNALVNIAGPDLYVFELGKYVEETILFVSKDGKNWINVGKIAGGNALVDIGDSTKLGDIFRYVKLVDANSPIKGGDQFVGADIDAIAAIGSAHQVSLNSNYAFDVNKAVLKSGSYSSLNTIADLLIANPNYEVVIQGHSDSTGTKAKNKTLSLQRAKAIETYLKTKVKNASIVYKTEGLADELPLASNKTPAGREKNRRVEIFLIPKK